MDWASLSRWERAEVGRDLRRQGLSYGEIMQLIPVPKGTLAGWCRDIELTPAEFYKTFVKPAGTGHRKNTLPHGVCRVLVRRSTDAWLRTMEWVDVLAANLPSGR